MKDTADAPAGERRRSVVAGALTLGQGRRQEGSKRFFLKKEAKTF
jgi:hypothetical protein